MRALRASPSAIALALTVTTAPVLGQEVCSSSQTIQCKALSAGEAIECVPPSPRVGLRVLGDERAGLFNTLASEIAAFEPHSRRLFVVNVATNVVDRSVPNGKPCLKPWRKGQSGNPAGKSKSLEDFRAACRQHSPEALAKLERRVSRRSTYGPRSRAAAGRPRSARRGSRRPTRGRGTRPLVTPRGRLQRAFRAPHAIPPPPGSPPGSPRGARCASARVRVSLGQLNFRISDARR